MVTGSVSRMRAVLGVRLLVLTLGVFLMIVPFAFMIATSFKPNALVL